MAGSFTLYGIPGCDTVKKARAWLDAHHVAYAFHDYRKAGVDARELAGWCDEVGWEALVNRRGTTFRKLEAALTSDLDRPRALALMQAHPSLIRRPVASGAGPVLVGFSPEAYAVRFGRR